MAFASRTAVSLFALAVAAGMAAAAPAAAEEGGDSLFDQDTLTGDWGGLRSHMISHGVTLGLKYTGEMFGNVSGGLRTGVSYENQFLLTGDFDFEQMADIPGLTGHVGAFSMQGRGPAFNLTGNTLDPSNIEYPGQNQRYTRLWTAWLQQTLADGAVSLRVGQMSVDEEFLVAPSAGTLINATFGWNALAAANLPGGIPNAQGLTNGAGYPLGAPGVRLQISPSENWAWLTAVTSSQPESPDRGGAQFRIQDAFIISEVQYLRNQAKDATGLPSVYKLGGWWDTSKFDDLSHDATGAPLLGDATPRKVHGEGAIYAVADQTVWRSPDGDKALSLFVRGHFAPDDDINTVGWYVDGGVAFKGPFDSRPSDVVTVGAAWAGVTGGARAADRLAGVPARDYESVIEVSYTATLAPWWTVQPDFQYIINPGFGALNPLATAAPDQKIDNAALFGLRTTITF